MELRYEKGLSVPTIGEGGDSTIPSPGMARKQPLPGIRLHDALHDRQAYSEFNSFHQGVVQISPPERLFSCRPLSKRGQVCYIPAPPPQSLNDSIVANTPETPARKETRGVKCYCRIEYHGRSHYGLDSGRIMHAPKKRREDKSPIHDNV